MGAQEGDPSCSSRGSRSCSSSRRRRPKLLLPRIQKLFLQLPEMSQRSHPPEKSCVLQKSLDKRSIDKIQKDPAKKYVHGQAEDLVAAAAPPTQERRSKEGDASSSKIQDEGSRSGMTQDSCPEPQADRVTIANDMKIVADVRSEAKRRFYKNWSQSKKKASTK